MEFPQVGIGDGCVLSTKSFRESHVWKPNATVVTPGQQCLGARCESGSLRGTVSHYAMPQRNGCARALDPAVMPVRKTQMDHVLAGLQSAEADNDNRRAWDRWTRAIRDRPKGSRDLDDTICGSVGEMGTGQARDHEHATGTADGWRVPLRGKCVRARLVHPPRAGMICYESPALAWGRLDPWRGLGANAPA